MDSYVNENRQKETDVASVESQRNDLIPEEFPEGPYEADLLSESLGKSSPWRIDQRRTGRFGYENAALHEGLDRDYPGEDNYGTAVPEVQDEP